MADNTGTTHIGPVATILEPAERTRVDAIGAGVYRTIHRDSMEEVLRDLKERRISAVLLSVSRYVKEEPLRVAAVVREFPRIPTLALLSGAGDASAETVLALGNSGVRTLVDVRRPAGWQRLRDLLGVEAAKDVDRTVIATLRSDLSGVPEDCWQFFEALFLCDRHVSTVRQFARLLNVLPSTLISRFFRAQLPAPKRYLAFSRLVRAARLFENPGLSVADVSNHLDYSSPQSFGRHVQTYLNMRAGEFRRSYDANRMFLLFRHELIVPQLQKLLRLHPLAARSGGQVIPGYDT